LSAPSELSSPTNNSCQTMAMFSLLVSHLLSLPYLTQPFIADIYIAIHLNNIFFFLISASMLTGFHFAVTALVGILSNATGYSSSSKHVPMWELLWFSMVANLSITAMNFSLMLNSVGFYQVFFFLSSSTTFIHFLYVFCKSRHTWITTDMLYT
jgi:hypothetical protein